MSLPKLLSYESETRSDLHSHRHQDRHQDNSAIWLNEDESLGDGDGRRRHGLFPYLKSNQLWLLLLGTFLNLCTGSLVPISVIFSGRFLNAAASKDMDTVNFYCLLLFISGIAASITGFTGSYLVKRAVDREKVQIQLNFFRSLVNQDEQYIQRITESLIYSTFTNSMFLYNNVSFNLTTFTILCGQFVVGFIIAFITHAKLALILSVLLPTLLVAGSITVFSIKFSDKRTDSLFLRAQQQLRDALENIRTVVSYSLEERFSQKYSDSVDQWLKVSMKFGGVAALGVGLSFGIIFGFYSFGFWSQSRLITSALDDGCLGNECLQVGDGLTVFFCIAFGSFSVGQALHCLTQLTKAGAALKMAMVLIDRPSAIPLLSLHGKRKVKVGESLEFVDVTYCYPETRKQSQTEKDRGTETARRACFKSRIDAPRLSSSSGEFESALVPLFKNLKFKIEPGHHVAFVGPSGCGKSTIAKLFMRFIEADEGSVRIDGLDVRDIHLLTMRSRIGYVGQECRLSDATIGEFIAMGKENASREEIVEASKRAAAHDFIEDLPEKYNTVIGPSGVSLSGGQRQRLALAQAFVRKPKLLILDEATSALDNLSEAKVLEGLHSMQLETFMTTISIAHRVSTVRGCDKVYVLDKVPSGYTEIVESGTHDHLILQGGLYSKLFPGAREEAESVGLRERLNARLEVEVSGGSARGDSSLKSSKQPTEGFALISARGLMNSPRRKGFDGIAASPRGELPRRVGDGRLWKSRADRGSMPSMVSPSEQNHEPINQRQRSCLYKDAEYTNDHMKRLEARASNNTVDDSMIHGGGVTSKESCGFETLEESSNGPNDLDDQMSCSSSSSTCQETRKSRVFSPPLDEDMLTPTTHTHTTHSHTNHTHTRLDSDGNQSLFNSQREAFEEVTIGKGLENEPTKERYKSISLFFHFLVYYPKISSVVHCSVLIAAIISEIAAGSIFPLFAYLFADIVGVLSLPDSFSISAGIGEPCSLLLWLALGAFLANALSSYMSTTYGNLQLSVLRRIIANKVLNFPISFKLEKTLCDRGALMSRRKWSSKRSCPWRQRERNEHLAQGGWRDTSSPMMNGELHESNDVGLALRLLDEDCIAVKNHTWSLFFFTVKAVSTFTFAFVIAARVSVRVSLISVVGFVVTVIGALLQQQMQFGTSSSSATVKAKDSRSEFKLSRRFDSRHALFYFITSVRSMQTLGTCYRELDNIERVLLTNYRSERRSAIVSSLLLGVAQFLEKASQALTLWYGARMFNDQVISSAAEMLRSTFTLVIAGMGVGQSSTQLHSFSKGEISMCKVKNLLDFELPTNHDINNPSGLLTDEVGLPLNQIEVKNLWFGYEAKPLTTLATNDTHTPPHTPPHTTPHTMYTHKRKGEADEVDACDGVMPKGNGTGLILKNVSFVVKANTCVALVGESGCGKTTIFSLLQRLHDMPGPTSIAVGNRDIRSWNLFALRSQIAWVDQSVGLFDDTIANNIKCGDNSASDAKMVKAAKQALCHDFISQLPDAYNYIVGKQGCKLSGGQRQRICLARAFLKEAKILLLDEATSALDGHSEKIINSMIFQSLVRSGVTVLVVAHRLETIKQCDSIIVLKKTVDKLGRPAGAEVIEIGQFEQLCRTNGEFSRTILAKKL